MTAAMREPSVIVDYHAHVYFDAASREPAARLREAVLARFPGATMGRWHERPIGPHPRWSYQIAFAPALLPELLPWLALNRGDLTVFLHPNTGDDLADHRDFAVWMGRQEELDLGIFRAV